MADILITRTMNDVFKSLSTHIMSRCSKLTDFRVGSALRTLVGVLTVTAISSGMNMAGVNPLWKNVVYGCVLIAAVAINSEKGGRDLIIK